MHSLRGWKWLVFGGLVGSAYSTALPTPAVTPAPRPAQVDGRSLQNRQEPDAIEVLQVLLTALPLSLRQIAATNIPAVSRILWEDFLDDNRPEWFNNLPYNIQSYFIEEFGPATAAPPVSNAVPTDVTASATQEPTETNLSRASNTESAAFESLSTSAAASSVLSGSESLSTIPTSTGSSSRLSSESSSSASSSSASSASAEITSSSATTFLTSRSSSRSSSATSSATADPVVPVASNSGLTRSQKIGIGVGVPLAVVAIAALLLGCCFLLRRKKQRSIEGNEPPSSPGFIPPFAFQDRALSSEHFDHRAPLNPNPHQTSRFVEDTNWEDDGYDPTPMATAYQGHTLPPAAAAPHQGNALPAAAAPMAMQDNHTPILAPALYHSHSSNRARGRRTSYTSLHSVAELTEPDDEMTESPILGRHFSPPKTAHRRPSVSALDMLPVPAVGSVKRKPVPPSPTTSPAAEASRDLLRPVFAHNTADHSGSSSSGLAISSMSTNSSGNAYYNSDDSAPISPITHQSPPPTNPFAGGYAYLEDYGPEYYAGNGYRDQEQDDEIYGGHRSLDRYPDPSPPPRRRSLKTDWPLMNVMGGGQKRTRSPMWDRVYERV
ncbi:hypothetical protein BDW02DRAFT_209969 [Decorospora gaudefroyi]|uniref:Mid2 domain-containing protein n=1 Tax=Decorospora gaudefroyi TaxID=184978 RepID=A0A6A5JYS9_9PLEO|nr:hypothetical protein BDW02DRAFT_209969 [Decorospora gaudefroyi]